MSDREQIAKEVCQIMNENYISMHQFVIADYILSRERKIREKAYRDGYARGREEFKFDTEALCKQGVPCYMLKQARREVAERISPYIPEVGDDMDFEPIDELEDVRAECDKIIKENT